METAAALILLTGACPLALAWRTHRLTSLVHALAWAALAGLAWEGVLLSAAGGWGGAVAARYGALCLTA
jgi:hypothetical protein